MSEYLLDIEKYLAHQVNTLCTPFSKSKVDEPFSFNEALGGLLRLKYAKEKGLSKLRSEIVNEYYMLDFHDFLEYATSNLTKEFKISQFPNNHIHYYQAFPNTYNDPLFESKYSKFSVMGVSLSRGANSLWINMQFRVFINEEKQEIVDLVGNNNGIIYEFVNLHLHDYNVESIIKSLPPQQQNESMKGKLKLREIPDNAPDEVAEFTRTHIKPPFQSSISYWNNPEYSIRYSGQMWEDQAIRMSKATFKPEASKEFIEFYKNQVEIVKDFHDYNTRVLADNFEIARLMVHLPSYFDFMHDLIIHEKKKTIVKRKADNSRKKKKKNQNRIIYKIIKSLRISYQAEEETRKKLNIPHRTWTAPSYRFFVSGHWRKIKYPYSKGHDYEGNIILGKTWVKKHEKGKDKKADTNYSTEVTEPNVIIKLKQPLSYAIDVIKSQEISKSQQDNLVNNKHNSLQKNTKTSLEIEDNNKPIREWIYQERIKLTAGLRWLILKRDNFKCVICGRGAEEGAKLQIDHILPVSKWGKTEESNLQTLCNTCNQGKGDAVD